MAGLKFFRQYGAGPYILDFYKMASGWGKGLKRKLRNIHNPLYPPYLKGDIKKQSD
jgi:hypothetical protein